MGLCGFHGFLGPEVGHPVAACGDVWQDLGTESEPGGLESWRLAARMVIFIDFHGIEGSVVLGLIFYGFHRF